jgi:serine-type D-Ala-D-Ala carboxypeptidase/endopeptidase (penicillin-binding protein 4)
MLVLLFTCLTLLTRGESIDAALGRPELKGARIALAVVDTTTGERVYARNIDEPMTPASNMKVLTAATALGVLGPGYHFSTRLVAVAPPDADGVLHGDLIVVGGGDPCLRAELLAHERVTDPAALLLDLADVAGVRHVTGRLIVDDGLMDHEWVHPDWSPGDVAQTYGAPVGALSLHANCLVYEVRGGSSPSVDLVTAATGFRVRNELRLADKSSSFEVGALMPDEQGVVRVQGSVGRAVGQRIQSVPVHDPSDFAGRCLLAEAARRGLAIDGGLAFAPGAAAALPAPVMLQSLETPLVNAVTVALKESDNSISDHLFKLLGAQSGHGGSFAGGAAAVAGYLARATGTPLDGVVLRDGSGLSPRNRVTARLLTDTLVAMEHAPPAVRDVFLRALPVSGSDGSLEKRLTDEPYRGAVRAKTGFIRGVSTLSGYVRSRGGRTYAFSILFNDYQTKYDNGQMKAIQDSICRALVDRS